MRRSILFISLLVPAMLVLGSCSDSKDLSVSDARSNACIAGDNCGVFFTIANAGDEADTLLGSEVGTDIAADSGLHTVVMNDAGEMEMTPIENIPVPASGTVELKPGSLHVMLMTLNQELAVGDTFPLTLTFEKAGEMTLDVTVQAEN